MNIAILRGINVGGKRKILMADLKVLFAGLGFRNISTYIQSGNVLFESDEALDELSFAEKIEAAILEQYGFEVPVMVFSGEYLKSAIAVNPYVDGSEDITKLHCTFLKEEPDSDNLKKIDSVDSGDDRCTIIGKCAFICCEGKYHQSKLSNTFFEKKLKVAATTRNWKTVLKLVELVG